MDRVASIIGRGMAVQIFKQIEAQGETGDSAEREPPGQSTLLHFR